MWGAFRALRVPATASPKILIRGLGFRVQVDWQAASTKQDWGCTILMDSRTACSGTQVFGARSNPPQNPPNPKR